MASRPGGGVDPVELLGAGSTVGREYDGEHEREMTAPLLLDAHFRGRILVVRPAGMLICETYERLRDGLLKFAAEEPAAIVVDLASMRVASASLLMVFATVRDRISGWPGVPIVLAAAGQSLRTSLDSRGVPRFVPTYRSVSEALESLDVAPQRRRRQVELWCDPASARLARRLIEQTCHEWGIPEMVTDAVVVASELTDNMVYHARSDGWLRLDLGGNMLTIAVADADPRLPQLRVPGLRGVGGRGLLLVDRLSRIWGTASQLSGGKVVWAVLTVPSQRSARSNSSTRSRAALASQADPRVATR
ncbi:MAG: STAS domain-containing protein [Pseudonocardiaceae bacterium]